MGHSQNNVDVMHVFLMNSKDCIISILNRGVSKMEIKVVEGVSKVYIHYSCNHFPGWGVGGEIVVLNFYRHKQFQSFKRVSSKNKSL